jgi:glycosyltransferase involved in cell wall biosynthesis
MAACIIRGTVADPRILVLLPEVFRSPGGIQRYGRLLLRSAERFASARGGALQALILNDRRSDLPEGPLSGFGGSRLRFASAALVRALVFRPHLVLAAHAHLLPLGVLAGVLARSRPVWAVAYGMEVWQPLPWLRRSALRRAHRVLAVSEFTRRRAAERNGVAQESVDVVPCALDPDFAARFEPLALATPAADQAPPVLLSVGRLDAREGAKGVGDVILALPKIAEAVPGVRYHVVGDGSALSALRALAERAGVAGQVSFLGRLDEEGVARAYAGCALLALPSRLEGFGIVFVEAGFFARPSLACAEGGAPEVVEEGVTGVLVEAGDPAAIAERVVALFGRPSELAALGGRARERALSRFSFAAFEERLHGLLARDLGRDQGTHSA